MSTSKGKWISMAAGLAVWTATLANAQTILSPYGQQGLDAGTSGSSYYYQSQGQLPPGARSQRFDQGLDSRSYTSPYYDWSQGRQSQSFDNRQFDRRSYASPDYDWSQGRQDLSRQFDRDFDSRSYASPYYDWSQGRQPRGFDDRSSRNFGDRRFDAGPYDRWQGTGRQWQYGGEDFGVNPYGQFGNERWRGTQRGPDPQFDQGPYGWGYGVQPYDQWQGRPNMGAQGFNQGFGQPGFNQDFGRQGFSQGFDRQYGLPSDQWQGSRDQFGRSRPQFQQGQSSGTERQGSRSSGGDRSPGGGQSSSGGQSSGGGGSSGR